MTHVTCRLTAKNRDQLRNPTLGNRVWATFTFFIYPKENLNFLNDCCVSKLVFVVLQVPAGRPRVPLEVPPGDRSMLPREQYQIALNTLFFYYPQYRHELNSSFGMDAISFQYTDWAAASLDDSSRNLAALDASIGDSNFVCPLNAFAAAYADAGLAVYAYFFSEPYAANSWPGWMGVMHGDEILFTFGHVLRDSSVRTGRWPITYTPAEKELSRRMMTYWTNFAKTG